jgi:hypothetical protein
MSEANYKKIIRSRLGVGGVILFSVTLLTSIVIIYLQGASLLSPLNRFTLEDFFISSVALVLVGFSTSQLTLRIVIEKEFLILRNVWRTKKVSLKNVSSLDMIATSYGVWILSVSSALQNHPIPTYMMANEVLLVKAIVEVAFKYNPNVSISQRITNNPKYGQPPFGVFNGYKDS